MTAIAELLAPHVRDLGGFKVRRVLPGMPRQTVGPFIFFDHMGPVQFAPGAGVDVRPHPHIGLATVTYLFEGALLHRDSLGNVQRIAAGDVNWMTAGRGIVHSERSPSEDRATGARMHGLQTWVALPRVDEDAAPSFTHIESARLPVLERDNARITVVAGHAFESRAPTPVFSDTLYAAIEFSGPSSLRIEAEHEERALYAVEGPLALDDQPIPEAHMAVLKPDTPVTLRADGPARAMLVGGARMDGPRFIWWNYVASSRERIEQAKDDWREQRFGKVPGETEFIPLP